MDNIDNEDLFGFEEETLGGLEDEFGPSFFFLLRNFGLNGNALRLAHIDILRERVAPFLKRTAAFAEIYAMADRSGSRLLNYQVSAGRLSEVQRNLLALGAPSAKVQHRFAKAIGEDFFEDKNSREQKGDQFFGDGQKKSILRVVAIALTPAPIGVPTRRFRQQSALELTSFCRRHTQTRG